MFNLDSASVANRPVLDDTAALVVATPPTHAPHNVVSSPRTRLTDGRSFFEWLSDDVSFQYLYQLWYQNQLERRQLAVAVLAVQETTAAFDRLNDTLQEIITDIEEISRDVADMRRMVDENSLNLCQINNDLRTVLNRLLGDRQKPHGPSYRQQLLADRFTDLSLDEPSTANIVELPSSPQVPHVHDANTSTDTAPVLERPSYSLGLYDEYDVPDLV